jgi:HAD superfamily phosphatase (TIGR01668 family)
MIKAVLLDVDNTLSPHGAAEPEAEVPAWLNAVLQSGIRVMIVSNNSQERVQPFAAKLGLEFETKAAKPLPLGFNRARNRLQCGKKETAVIGDQLFTDMLGANLAGMTAILVEPIEPETMLQFRVKRKLEIPILAWFRWRQERRKKDAE